MQAQNEPKINADQLIFDFGTIEEAKGPVSHVFTINNAGNAPLVITRITASCGCTQPEWSKAPIAPGKDGEVKVTYNPKGRPGPFYKTISIYSNATRSSFSLGIKGNVTPKPIEPEFIYPYSIGPLKLETKQVLFSTIRPDEIAGQTIHIKNEGDRSFTIHLGKLPAFVTATANPEKLMPGEAGEISVILNTKQIRKKGRISAMIPVYVTLIGEKESTESQIHISANLIDNFSKLSATEKTNAPVAQLSGTLLDFGKLPSKAGAIPFIGGKVTGTFDITNTGKSPLIIYSVTCDDSLVDLSGGKREIKPGNTATFKVALNPKDIKTKLETLINIVCNDPNGPVRLIKVTAEK